ncbi:hypothetical protein BDR03DRAFT_850344, partial [Suillus americanus]
KLPSRMFADTDDGLPTKGWKDLVRDFSLLSDFQIPAPYEVGITYDTVCVNPLEYLP